MADESPHAEGASKLAPVSAEERFPILDVLRGFALLGIIVMNMPGFSTPAGLWSRDELYFPGFADRATEFVTGVIFAGKANSIFSFLFGLGLTIQIQRAAARGQKVTSLYLRRIAILFLIGAAHGILIWNGDVLHMYAILGLVLLTIRNVPDRVVLGLIVLALMGGPIRSFIFVARNEPFVHPNSFWVAISHEHMRIFSTGTYLEQIQARLFLYSDMYNLELLRRVIGPIWGYLSFLVTILLGFYAGRRRLLENVTEHLGTIRKIFWWSLGLGLAASAGFSLLVLTRPLPPPTGPTFRGFFTGLLFQLNRPLLCVAYICAFALLFQKDTGKKVLMVLVAPGRMPLTNYLMQSLIATTLCNSYGFALFGKVGPLVGFGISIAIFVVQVYWSKWWLARFQFGPLEWLWRAATYGKRFPMRRETPKPVPSALHETPV